MTMDTDKGPEYGDGTWSEPTVGVDHEFWSENTATYADYRYHLQYGGTTTMGPSQQNYDGGINFISNVHSMKFLYSHNDVTYNYSPTIVGNDLDNTIQGPSDYEANYDGFSTAPAMTIYGGAGDDTIIGYNGVDRFSGGTGNDWINTGGGADQVYGGEGNDMLLSGSISGQSGNEVMYGGSGADTFVLGDGTSAATPGEMGMIEWHSPYDDEQQTTHDMLSVMSKIPKVGAVFSAASSLFDYLNGTGGAAAKANEYSATTVLAESNAVQIMDFDPTEDMIVIPLSANEWGQTGELSLSIDTSGIAEGQGFRIYSDGSQWGADNIVNHKLIATINWDDLDANLPDYVTSALDSAEVMEKFENSVLSNMLIIDGEAGTITNGVGDTRLLSEVDTSAYGSNFTDTVMATGNKVLVMGTSIGTHQIGSSSADYMFGGNMDDFLYGYDVDDSTGAASANNDHLYGFEGDDVFVSGAGTNSLFGGEDDAGSDTAAYYDAVGGVTVTLEDAGTATIGGTDYNYGTASAVYANDNTGFDYLYDIENVIGGSGDDDITGDAGANQLSGGAGGTDVLTGNGGADTFVFSGNGSVTVTDYAEDDQLVFDTQAELGSQNTSINGVEDLNVSHVSGDSVVSLAATGEAIVTVQNATITADDLSLEFHGSNGVWNAMSTNSPYDTVNGTSGADLFDIDVDAAYVHAGAGDDMLVNKSGWDVVFHGDDGADTFVFEGGYAQISDFQSDDIFAVSTGGEYGAHVTDASDLDFTYVTAHYSDHDQVFTKVTVADTGQLIANVWGEGTDDLMLTTSDVTVIDDAFALA